MLRKLFGQWQRPSSEVAVSEAQRQLAAGEALLIDVREADEWRAGHVAGAQHIPLGGLARGIDNLPRDRRLLVICHSGARSASAVRQLRAAGFTQVDNVAGGMLAWARQGLPIRY